jgi:hypothetical protein
MQTNPSPGDNRIAGAEQPRSGLVDAQELPRHAAAPPRAGAYTSSGLICPSCHGSINRTWRRPGDRMLSYFTPLARYRCASHDCRWEGNLRLPRGRQDTAGDAKQDSRNRTIPVTFIVHMALTLVATGFVFVVAAMVE